MKTRIGLILLLLVSSLASMSCSSNTCNACYFNPYEMPFVYYIDTNGNTIFRLATAGTNGCITIYNCQAAWPELI